MNSTEERKLPTNKFVGFLALNFMKFKSDAERKLLIFMLEAKSYYPNRYLLAQDIGADTRTGNFYRSDFFGRLVESGIIQPSERNGFTVNKERIKSIIRTDPILSRMERCILKL